MRALRSALIASALAALLALASCGADEPELGQGGAAGTAAEPRDWLMLVARAHAQADELLTVGKQAEAATTLRSALQLAVPAEVAAEHVRVVHQDLWYRLSAVDLELEPLQALLEAERGLALGERDDLFSVNLLVARGHALQALGRDTEAASSYHRALRIDERLLNAALAPQE